jgi:hypothetical protein
MQGGSHHKWLPVSLFVFALILLIIVIKNRLIIIVMVHDLLKGRTGEGFEDLIFERLPAEADRSLVQRFLG